MKEKFKKIVATTIISMTAGTAIGCANTDSKIANKINNGVNDFVSSINKLDYVDTNNTSSNLGKIVSAVNETSFFNKMAKKTNIEDTITTPSERKDNFKLYVLSETPFISLTSSDNSVSLSMQFSTEKIETTSDDISEKINKLIVKRAILMIYVNEIYSGNVNLTEDNKTAINAYVNVIKENASFLNGNRGMVKNQLGLASNLLESETNNDIVNYYIIKSGEALEIRSNKIDSTISAIESIISILEQNLKPTSCYYQNSLSTKYDNMISNLTSENITDENIQLAKSIAESVEMINTKTNTSQIGATNNTNSNNTNQNIENNTQANSNNQNNNNGLTTLEEKTQNKVEISENQSNNNSLSENSNNLTPAQRARIRRQERLNRQRILRETNQNNTIDNERNSNSTTHNFISQEPSLNNKTARADRSNQNTNSINQDNFDKQNMISSTTHTPHGNAVRVPYKATIVTD